MPSRIPVVAAGLGAALAAVFAWVGGAAAAVFSFLGSGLLLGVLYGRTGSGVGTVANGGDVEGMGSLEQDAGASTDGRDSGLRLGPGLVVYVLGGFCTASVFALGVLIVV